MGYPYVSSVGLVRWWQGLSILVVAFSLGCGAGTQERPPLRVGVLANFTGEYAETSGTPLKEGALLAAQRINDAGGVLVGGQRVSVELVFKDFANRAEAAATAARSLINQDGVDMLIGPPFSRHAIPVSVLADNARVPMITPMSTNPQTTEGKRFVYRMSFLDDFQATAMARFSRRNLQTGRAAVVYNISSAYSRQMNEIFQRESVGLGVEIIAVETYSSDHDSQNYEEIFARVADANPDVVWLPNWARDTAEQLRVARTQGVEAVFLGGDTWDLGIIGEMPEAQGAFVVHQWHEELRNEKTEAFIRVYRETFGREPKITAAMTYDALSLVELALASQRDASSESILRGLQSLKSMEGVTGSIRYNGGRDPQRPAVIGRIENGRNRLYELVEP